MLVSDVQQNDSITYIYIIHFFIFFSIIGYHRILNIVSYTIWHILISYLFYM